jgi:hypothetical protein
MSRRDACGAPRDAPLAHAPACPRPPASSALPAPPNVVLSVSSSHRATADPRLEAQAAPHPWEAKLAYRPRISFQTWRRWPGTGAIFHGRRDPRSTAMRPHASHSRPSPSRVPHRPCPHRKRSPTTMMLATAIAPTPLPQVHAC